MRIKYKEIFLSIALACLLLQACDNTENIEPEEPDSVHRTVLIYMAADNNLDGFAKSNIEAILQGMQDVKGRVVIYYDPRYSTPSLLTIEKKGNKSILDTIEQYPEENSSSPEVLNRVAKKVQELYPADSHGLFLWSHATGWLPEDASFPNSRVQTLRMDNLPLTKTWGHDDHLGDAGIGNSEMEIKELFKALPTNYTFILFDACFMSTIEVFYELRNNTEYIIASPVEILAAGFPYKEIMPFLWGGEDEFKKICKEFFNCYENHIDGEFHRSGVVTLAKTTYLDSLASCVGDILKGKENDASHLPINAVDRYPMANFNQNVFFDLEDYIQQFADEKQKETFDILLDKTIIYKLSTTKYWGTIYDKEKYCSISTYIPLNIWSTMNEKYFELSWYQLVYSK